MRESPAYLSFEKGTLTDRLKWFMIVSTSSAKNPKQMTAIIRPPIVAPIPLGSKELQVTAMIDRMIRGASNFSAMESRVIRSPFSPTQTENENPVFLKYHT